MPRLQKPDCLLNAFIFKEWEFVRATRKYLSDLILGIFKDQEYAEKVATASSELIENAYKYSPANTDFNIILQKTDREITLQIRNYTSQEGATVLSHIQKEIELVWGEADAQEAFRKKMMASLMDPSGKSQLGYAKIRLETGAAIHAELEEKNLLLVTLTFQVDPTKLKIQMP